MAPAPPHWLIACSEEVDSLTTRLMRADERASLAYADAQKAEDKCEQLQGRNNRQFDLLKNRGSELLAYKSAHERDLQRITEAQDERDQLIILAEKNGFEVMRGDFVMKDGTHGDFYLRPNDVRRLIVALTSAYGAKSTLATLTPREEP